MEGDRVPADALLVESAHLEADESLLTGESVPVRKRVVPDPPATARPGGDDLPFVYAGTLVEPRLIEQAGKRPLEWFFDDWVYRDRGLPDFRVESVFPRATLNGTYVVTVTVANDGEAAAEKPRDAP